MSAAGTLRRSPRLTMEPLVFALSLSLAAHLVVWGGYEVGHHFGWWQKEFLPAWLRKAAQILTQVKPNQPSPPRVQPEISLEFVEVNPANASVEKPKDAKYYSAYNAKAANPDALLDTSIPKLDGNQSHVPKTENAPRSKAMPLQPALSKPSPADSATDEKPKGGQKVGDLAMAKTRPADQPKDGETAVETHQRPRTLAEARQQNSLPGEMMKQDGGVKNRMATSLLDTVGTPFGEYDAEIIRAIQMQWDNLLDQQTFTHDRAGRVVLEFRLNYDGRVTDMKVIETTVDEILTWLCRRAITDPAPYRPWPADMRRTMGADFRDVRFTFYYD
jgi:outer membrane biosynthesis protein TonB